MPASEDDGNILHETDVEDSVKAELEEVGEVGFDNANITDASVAHALNATFNDVEVESALNALGTKINLILDVLEANGLMAGA
jgi:hypothetical protein